MCGIVGCWLPSADSSIYERVSAGTASISHRGPDDSGVLELDDGRLVFGNRRLAILDLSHAGHQPMSTPDGRYHITFNGEVYNFAQLRQGLERRGFNFRSASDTEVLLRLYEYEGPDSVQKLRGMFAFAIYDSQERRLFLARDRLGIKPIYLARDGNGGLWFASEVKALLAAEAIRPQVDPTGLVNLMTHGLVPAPMSLFDGVGKLEPGHTLTIDANGAEKLECYWDVFDGIDTSDSPLVTGDEDGYLDQLELALAEAVELRLISDVPVGTLLSGGVDSSLVTALAARAHAGIQTFSIGYRGYRHYDELEWAHRVSAHLGTQHSDVWVDADSVAEALPIFLRSQEEPASDPQWLSIYFLSKLAQEHGVTVVLTGDGGDEVFAGYSKWEAYLRTYQRYWRPLMTIPPYLQRLGANFGPLLPAVPRDMLARAAGGHEFFWGGTQFKDHEIRRLIRPEILAETAPSPAERISAFGDRLAARYGSKERFTGDRYLDWMTYVALKTSVAENFLLRLDKMGMAVSREGRVPLLDHEVIRIALAAPPSLRLKGGQGKYLLKRILERHLPADIVYRRKMGFQSPMAAWMESGLAERVGEAFEILSELDLFIDLDEARRVLRRQDTDGRWPTRKWLLVNLALWYRTFLGSESRYSFQAGAE